MADSSDENAKEVDPLMDLDTENDDITVVTATTTTKTDFIAQEMDDSIIRYEIPYRNGHANDDDFKLHSQLLQVLTKVYDDTELRIYDNKSNRIKEFTGEKWMDQSYHGSHFNYYDDTVHRKTVIAHRILSQKPIASLKGDSKVLAFLKKSNTYLRAHFWKEDELAIKDIGFLVSYVPSKHSKAFVINDMVERTDLIPDLDWAKVPKFKLIHATPRVKLPGRQKPLHSQAYSVQILTKDTKAMNQALRQMYAQDHLYLPYNLKRTAPKAIAKAIINQNKRIADTYVIVLVGISRNIMTALKPTLLQGIQSIIAVSDTNRTDKNGRWNVLVQEKGFITTRKYIATNLPLWLTSYPQPLHENTPDHFPAPQVSQKYADLDDDSSGQASYMSSCAQSYGSLEDLDSDAAMFYSPDSRSTTPSYADVVKQTHPSDAVNRRTTKSSASIDTATTHPETVEIRSQQTQIAELKAEITIANLQAEVQRLTAQMKAHIDAQTPSTVTAASAEIPSPIGDRMAKIENSMELLTATFTKWMEKDINSSGSQSLTALSKRQNQYTNASPSSNQSKKRDTRLTPTRDDPMYTQPTGMDTDARIRLFQEEESIRQQQERHRHRRMLQQADPQRYHIGGHDHPYDPNRDQQIYQDNGDGSLFSVGTALPRDFDQYGNIRGPRPSPNQPIYGNSIQRRREPSFSEPPPSHQTSPMRITDQYNQGQPSPQRTTQHPVMGSEQQRLLAEGAIIDA
jgi:hypothetical protein